MKIKHTIVLAYVFAGSLLLSSVQVQAAELSARLDWAELHYATTPVDGFVDSVLVQTGQRVTKGEKLFQLNTTVLTAKVNQARARVAAAKPVFADARREYQDAQALYEQTVLSDVELQRAKMGFDIAAAKLDEAEAMRVIAEALLARSAHYAPWDGWVIERRLESGQMIAGDTRSQALLTLARADSRVAEAAVEFEIISQLKLGQALKVRYREHSYTGKLQSMSLSAASSDQKYALRVEFSVDPERVFKIGDKVSIVLP